MQQHTDRETSVRGTTRAARRLVTTALAIALLGGAAVAKAQTADERAWIEDACPQILGPAGWKNCAERHLQALRAGLPDLTRLTNKDRAWIADACPRILGPAGWKNCAERHLQALRAGLPSLTRLTNQDRGWIADACPRILGPAGWKNCAERHLQALGSGLPELDAPGVGRTVPESDGAAVILPFEAEPELDQANPANGELTEWTAAANDDADLAPELPAPEDGERWFCYTDEYSAALSMIFSDWPEPELVAEPEVVLTRNAPTNTAIGRGRVRVAGVIYDAEFSIEGIQRRWDWNDHSDTIAMNPGGDGAYYDFRLLEDGETHLEQPTALLWCTES